MSIDKDIFSGIVKEKLENFEVPYNAEHWSEMNDQLDQMQPQTGGSSVAGTAAKYALVAGIAAAIIGGVYFLSNPTEIENKTIQEEMVAEKDPIQTQESGVVEKSEKSDEVIEQVPEIEPEKQVSTPVDQSVTPETPEAKADRYESYSEAQIKEEGKEFVEEMVAAQQTQTEPDPILNNRALKSDITIEGSTIHCTGQDVQFGVSRELEGVKYYWNFGDKGLTSRKNNPKHTFKNPGTYNVTLIVSKGEKDDYKTERSIEILSSPTAEITWPDKEITLSDPYMSFTASSNQNCTYEWVFNESEKAKGTVIDFLIKNKGVYPVALKATAETGCSTEVHESFRTDKGMVMIVEDAFTPNGDGLNDDFIPSELKYTHVEFTLIISDKSGQRIYETHDGNSPWNGRMNNSGNVMPEGSYPWIVSFQDERGVTHTQQGKVMIKSR